MEAYSGARFDSPLGRFVQIFNISPRGPTDVFLNVRKKDDSAGDKLQHQSRL